MRAIIVIASTLALLACGPGEPSDDGTRGSDTIADGDATETDDGDDQPSDGDGEPGGGDGEPGDGDGDDTNCSEVVENLVIDADTDPASVACVRVVNNRLDIEATNLVDLSLLPALEQAGWIRIENNPQLQTLAGLDSLTQIDTWLSLRANPQLSSLSGLTNIESINAVVITGDNLSLQSLGLPAQVSLAAIQLEGWDRPDLAVLGDLDTSDPELWVNLSASQVLTLDGLADCCSTKLLSLWMEGLPLLEDLTGLENFAELELVHLYGVPALSSLAGLEAEQIGHLEIAGAECDDDAQWSLDDLPGLNPEANIDTLTVTGLRMLASLDQLPTTLSVGHAEIYNNVMLSPATAEAWVAAAMPASSFVCGNGGANWCHPEPVGPCPQ